MSQSVTCVFCFNPVAPNEEISDARLSSEITVTFLKFVQRYFNRNTVCENEEPMASLFGRFCAGGNINCCPDCNQMMSRFLDLYQQLKLIELKANWSLFAFGKVMSTAAEEPSRVKAFNESAVCSNDDAMKTLRILEICSFRQDLITKCHQNYHEEEPKIKLKRHVSPGSKETNKSKLVNNPKSLTVPTSTPPVTNLAKASNDNPAHFMRLTPISALLSLWLIVSLKNFVDKVKLLRFLSLPINKVNLATPFGCKPKAVAPPTQSEPHVVTKDKAPEPDVNSEHNISISDNHHSPASCNANDTELTEPIDVNSCANSPMSAPIAGDDSDHNDNDDIIECQTELEKEVCSGEKEMEPDENVDANENSAKRPKLANYLENDKMKDIIAGFVSSFPPPVPRVKKAKTINKTKAKAKQIINRYANNEFKYFTTKNKGSFSGYKICKRKSQARIPPQNPDTISEEALDTRIKILSQHLKPVQQRLTAALLHDPKYACNVDKCSEQFVFKKHLEAHSKLHGEFKCRVCSHVEAYAPKLGEHVLTKHCKTISSTKNLGTFITCPIDTCESVEYDSRNYIFHFVKNHLGLDVSTLGCLICHCSVGFSNHFHFRRFHDIFNMKPGDVYQCESCPAFFPTHTKLSLHWIIFHNKATTQCAFCNKEMGKYGFKKHQARCKARNMDSYTHQCSFPNCNKKFRTESLRNWHMRTCTFNPEGIWHNCSKCKMRYRDEEQLKKHLEGHMRVIKSANTRQKMCEVCGKSVSAQGYASHMKWHSGPENWKHMCPHCGKKFVNGPKLREHMRTHTKDVWFVCEFCGSKYAHAHNLRLHVEKKHGRVSAVNAETVHSDAESETKLNAETESSLEPCANKVGEGFDCEQIKET